MVFDKTGTITHGRPVVAFMSLLASAKGVGGLTLAHVLAVVGAAESGSEHPLGTAVVKFVCQALGIESVTGAKVSGFRTVPGKTIKILTLTPLSRVFSWQHEEFPCFCVLFLPSRHFGQLN